MLWARTRPLTCRIPIRCKGSAKKLEFLVVQDIFLTETAKLADVVLPSLSWAEKDGTFTNMERRIQRVRKAVHREGMEDWKIIAEVSRNMGGKLNYSDSESVFHEISDVSPLYRNLTYADIEHGHAIYPYKGEPLRDVMEEIQISKGKCSAFRRQVISAPRKAAVSFRDAQHKGPGTGKDLFRCCSKAQR